MRRYLVASLIASLSLVSARAGAQRVVGHVPFLDAAAGFNPLGLGQVAANPSGDEVYVLSGRGVTVIHPAAANGFVSFALDPANPAAVPTLIAVEDSSGPDRRFYVADPTYGIVHTYRAAPLAELSNGYFPTFGYTPGALALDATHNILWIAASDSDEVHMWETGTGMERGTGIYTLTAGLGAMVADPVRGRAYVIAPAENEVLSLDLAGRAVRTVIPVPANPTSIAINPSNGKVYVVSLLGNTDTDNIVSVIDEATDTVVASPAISGAAEVKVAATGKAWVRCSAVGTTAINTLVGIDGASNATNTITLTGVGNLAGFDLNADGKKAFVTDAYKATRSRVSVVDLVANSATAPVETG